jgi:hypothetical protein
MVDAVEVHASARRHDIADEDMVHAVLYAIRVVEHDYSMAMVLGPDRAGRLLEVGVVDLDGDEPVIVHAMPMRWKYQRFL